MIERSIAAWNATQSAGGGEPYSVERELTEAVLDGVEAGATTLTDRTAPETGRALSTAHRIETPFLQVVMERLWGATREQGSHTLTLRTMEQLGGPQAIVRRHLERAMEQLADDEQAVAAEVFRFLVTSSNTKIAQRASDLADWTSLPDERVLGVLEQLASDRSGRILRPLPPIPGTTSPLFEIFHDVLAEPIVEWRKAYRQRINTAAAAKAVEEAEQRRARAGARPSRRTGQPHRPVVGRRSRAAGGRSGGRRRPARTRAVQAG